MVLQDFDSYDQTKRAALLTYGNLYRWQKMSLNNIAQSGFFCADRAIEEYAAKIWGIK